VKLAVEAKAIRGLSQAVLDTFRNVPGAILGRIDEVGMAEFRLKLNEGVEPDWRAKGDELLARMAGAEKPVVVLLDELPVMVNVLLKGEDLRITPDRIERARLFLSWLREATIRHQDQLRFVACGSIGLEPLLSRAGISEVMTTFTPFELGPWDDKVARAFLEDRAARAGIEFQGSAEDRILKLIGYNIPQHVQMFMRFIYEDAKQRVPHTCTPKDVDRLYKERMLSIHGHVDLATYEDRLKRVVRPELVAAALELLTEAAVSRRLTPQAAITIVKSHVGKDHVGRDTDSVVELRFLLGIFTHDGYLKMVGNNSVFVSHLLRDWRKRRFSFGYIRLDKRTAGDRT